MSSTPTPPPPIPTPIKIGILGCAEIARKLSRAITLSPNSTLSAIASRSHQKATKFATDNNFPINTKTYASYDAVLDDPDIDAVYIPLPTSLHIKWAVLAAKKKKHVLLEKPVAMDVNEFDEIVKVCDESGVQIMDGTMWVHNLRTKKMEEFLSDGELFGELKSIHSCFTFAADEDFLENDIRVKPDLDAHGALGDIGWYCIRSILWAANFELPKSVLALRGTIFNKAGIILSCSAFLQWEDGKTATFHCSFLSNLAMDLTVVGTNGTLHLNDFVIPFEENKAGFTTAVKSGFTELVTGWDPKPSQHMVFTDLPQEALMVQEFCRLVTNIKVDGAKPEKKWPDFSRKTQLVLNAVKLSTEKGYETVEITG